MMILSEFAYIIFGVNIFTGKRKRFSTLATRRQSYRCFRFLDFLTTRSSWWPTITTDIDSDSSARRVCRRSRQTSRSFWAIVLLLLRSRFVPRICRLRIVSPFVFFSKKDPWFSPRAATPIARTLRFANGTLVASKRAISLSYVGLEIMMNCSPMVGWFSDITDLVL